MKCEHEGCKEAPCHECIAYTEGLRWFCRAHLAAWLRAKADEVEGVRVCETCEGDGSHPVFGAHDCPTCNGTGRVKR